MRSYGLPPIRLPASAATIVKFIFISVGGASLLSKLAMQNLAMEKLVA